MWEIKFSGFGGQGIVRCALITGKAISLYDDKFATMTQSFGPEARGGACQSQLIISDSRIALSLLHRAGRADRAVSGSLRQVRTRIWPTAASSSIEEELVKPSGDATRVRLLPLPATRIAEELGNRLFANLVVLGFFSAITGAVIRRCDEKGACRAWCPTVF